MAFKKIRELTDFDISTLDISTDHLVVSDGSASGINGTKKITIRDLIGAYNVKLAEEQVAAGDNEPQLITDANGNFVSADPVTAANLDDFVQPDSGLEVITSCVADAATGNQVCSKRLSIAKSKLALDFFLFVTEAAGINNDLASKKTVDFYWRMAPREGYPANSPSLITPLGKTTDTWFSNVSFAQHWAVQNCPAGANVTILLMGDITNESGLISMSRIGDCTFMDYNAWAYEQDMNTTPHINTSTNQGYMWPGAGYGFTKGMTVLNKNPANQQDGSNGYDGEYYRCHTPHTSGAFIDKTKFHRVTCHNCHGAFSVANGEQHFVKINANTMEGQSAQMATTDGTPTTNSVWDANRELNSSQYSNAHLDTSFGGLTSSSRAIFRVLPPVSNGHSSFFTTWTGNQGGALSFYSFIFIGHNAVGEDGGNRSAGYWRWSRIGGEYLSINNMDFVALGNNYRPSSGGPLDSSGRTVHIVEHMHEFIEGTSFRVFDSGRLATIPNPYGANYERHGMALYTPTQTNARRVRLVRLFQITNKSTVLLANEYWGAYQPNTGVTGGVLRRSSLFFGTDIICGAIMGVDQTSFVNCGQVWLFAHNDITFTSGRIQNSTTSGAKLSQPIPIENPYYTGSKSMSASDSTGPTTVDSSRTQANWDTNGAQVPFAVCSQFSSISVNSDVVKLPGVDFDSGSGTEAFLLTNDGFASFPRVTSINFYKSSSELPAAYIGAINKEWSL
tara:strand:- start:53759 stop:55951 length:2193 start_codon:yes stop_codon:yes gene_type:complete